MLSAVSESDTLGQLPEFSVMFAELTLFLYTNQIVKLTTFITLKDLTKNKCFKLDKEEIQLLLQRLELIHLALQGLARFAKLGIALVRKIQLLVHKHNLDH